jgi:hypothetical protein
MRTPEVRKLDHCWTCQQPLAEEPARREWTLLGEDDDQMEVELLFRPACVRQEDRGLLLDAYRDALDVLDEEVTGSRMFRNVWRRGNEALGWLYMLDNFHDALENPENARSKTRYRGEREKNDDGRTLIGLRWARGQAVHSLWQFEGSGTQPFYGGEARVFAFRADTTVWAPLDSKKEKWGFRHYAQQVEGKPLMAPLWRPGGSSRSWTNRSNSNLWGSIGRERDALWRTSRT